MKKIIIMILLFLPFIPTKCDLWTSIITGTAKAVNGISNIADNAKKFFSDQLPGCAEVVGLGTAYGTASAALQTAKFAVNGAELVGKKTALNAAKGILEGAKQSSLGVLTLADALAKGIDQGFNITCIKFYGSIQELEFEVDAILLGKSINIRDKVDISDLESFAQKIFNKLEDKAKDLF